VHLFDFENDKSVELFPEAMNFSKCNAETILHFDIRLTLVYTVFNCYFS